MARIRRILHPTDFSTASTAAFTKAVEFAKMNRADLVVLHVIPPPVPIAAGDAYMAPQVYEDLDRSARAYASEKLTGLVTRAKKAGVAASALVRSGIVPDEIVRAARSRRADLIVIGTHGRTGLAKLFLGSVAARVVATATSPVMTVRGR